MTQAFGKTLMACLSIAASSVAFSVTNHRSVPFKTTRSDYVSTTFLPRLSTASIHLHAKGKNFEDETRKERKAKQKEIGKQFATGEDLKRLRHDLDILRDNLLWAQAMDDHDRVHDLSSAIRIGEKLDPDVAYAKALRIIAETKAARDMIDADKRIILQRFQDRAQAARSLLPRFQLDGLWIGNYGDHGEELINVTYVGDTLLATKVTGDENIPRGQVSFTADLTPRNDSNALEPIKLSLDQSSSTAAATLPRYAGKGQVAKRGFVDHKYIDGQLVMFEKHFSFVWVPIRHHVLFRRPPPEQTLSMLRDTIAKEDELENTRAHLSRCYELDMTDSLARQASNNEQEPIRRISMMADLKSLEERLKAQAFKRNNNINSFWNSFNFSKYFDGIQEKNKKKNNNRSDEQKA